MTEAEWLTASDPALPLEFLKGSVSDRKLRLFSVSCCRQLWHLMEFNYVRSAVELSEALADGQVTEDARAEAAYHLDAGATALEAAVYSSISLVGCPATGAAYAARSAVSASIEDSAWGSADDVPASVVNAQVHFLHDIFGNPFRPVTFSPEWRTSTAVALAMQMYESRDFSAMPILADALQDAGCDNEDILNHCRQPGEHVRGCWVVDLVLGKS